MKNTSKEMSKKAERIMVLASIIEDLERTQGYYATTDENGNQIPPTEDVEYDYVRFNIYDEVIKAVSKLA